MDEATLAQLQELQDAMHEAYARVEAARALRDAMIVNLVTNGVATKYELAKALGVAESTVGRVVASWAQRQ